MLSGTFVVVLALIAHDPPETSGVEIGPVVVSVLQQVEVPARAIGSLQSLNVDEGDLVEKGQLLATIDDGDAALTVKRAEIDLQTTTDEAANEVRILVAEKSLALANSELARAKKSRALFKDVIPEEEVELRQLKVDKASLDLKQAEHEHKQAQQQQRLAENDLAVAQRNQARHRIEAPFAGMVVEVNRRAGEWCEPGQTVLRIVRLDRLRAEELVNADQLKDLKAGQAVRLRLGSEREASGVLKFISPEINPVDGRVRIWAEIDNRKLTIKPGERATMYVLPK